MTKTIVKEPKAKSTRSTLQDWVRERIEDSEEVQVPVLVNEALEHFQSDRRFLQQFFAENGRTLMYEFVQKLVGQSRSGRLLIDDAVVSREAFMERARRKSTWAGWLEHVGNRHVLLMDMDREQLALASAERRQRGDREHELANLWSRLASRLEGGQVVRDVWTADEIETVRLELAQA